MKRTKFLTKFRLDKTIGDSRAVGSYRLSVNHPEKGELWGQCVHDHGEITLSDLDKEPRLRTKVRAGLRNERLALGSSVFTAPFLNQTAVLF